jgi:hypothetical protein
MSSSHSGQLLLPENLTPSFLVYFLCAVTRSFRQAPPLPVLPFGSEALGIAVRF